MLAPGIINTDYIKLTKNGESIDCAMTFPEFLQFFIILSMIQMTNYDFDPFKKTTKKFKVGERLKCPIDKVYRVLSFFKKGNPVNVPKIEGYLEPEVHPRGLK